MTIHQPSEKANKFISGTHRLLIGGKWQSAVSGKTFEVFDPATGRVVAEVPEGDAADVDLAVKAARQSFDRGEWRGLSEDQRSRILWRFAELLEINAEELAHIDVVDNGMPLALASAMVEMSASRIRHFARVTANILGSNASAAVSDSTQSYHAYTARVPVGVVGLIIPWNGPLGSFVSKIAPALAAGCSCIVKPAENTPLCALRLGELALEAGVPEGVINIVTGFGATAGQAIVDHPLVDKISFTGSTEVGKHIVRSAAASLKRVSLELGGKSPCIVLDDADLDVAIQGAAQGIFINSGQFCVAGSRLFVQKKSFDAVVSGIADIARSLKLGSGFDTTAQLGPVISAKQKDRIAGYIENGRKQGAQVVAGGEMPDGEGYFVTPTIFAGVDANAPLMKEEIFGPVLVATAVDDIDEIVRMANDTRYGLAAGVFTNDLNKAHRIAERVEAGTVWVNCYGIFTSTMPFGGFKESGWGREMGVEGLDAFLETKSVLMRLKP